MIQGPMEVQLELDLDSIAVLGLALNPKEPKQANETRRPKRGSKRLEKVEKAQKAQKHQPQKEVTRRTHALINTEYQN